MKNTISKSDVKGPLIYKNWKAFLAGKEALDIFEFPLFSDARVTGQEMTKYEPYVFMNPVPDSSSWDRGYFRPIIYVRITSCLEFEIPDMSKTNTTAYHGGTSIDEVAALVSLALGIRIRAGARSRDFNDRTDPRGRPVGWRKQPEFLSIDYVRSVVPNARGERPLSLLSPLSSIPLMSPEDANALIKASRSYQKALLIVEDEPSTGWLYLVSAIEIAANHWKTEGLDNLDVLKELKADFCEKFDFFENKAEILKIVAEDIGGLFKSRKKFIDFLINFLPGPPDIRPAQYAQLTWKADALKKPFDTIYTHRSKALHEATPFPALMCEPPMREREGTKAWHEKLGKGSGCPTGTWKADDVPMFLNTFEYIVRNSLLKWWLDLKSC